MIPTDADRQRLAETESRATAATPGPWIARDTKRHRKDWSLPSGSIEHDGLGEWAIIGGTGDDDGWSLLHGCWEDGTIEPEPTDLDFVAAARADVPWLAAQLRAAWERLDETEQQRRAAAQRFEDLLEQEAEHFRRSQGK